KTRESGRSGEREMENRSAMRPPDFLFYDAPPADRITAGRSGEREMENRSAMRPPDFPFYDAPPADRITAGRAGDRESGRWKTRLTRSNDSKGTSPPSSTAGRPSALPHSRPNGSLAAR